MENQIPQSHETLKTMVKFYKKVIDLYIHNTKVGKTYKNKKCHKIIKDNLSKMYDVDDAIKEYLKSDPPNSNSADVKLPDTSPESLDSIFKKLKCIDKCNPLVDEFRDEHQVTIQNHFKIYLHNRITKIINADNIMYKRVFNAVYENKIGYLKPISVLNTLCSIWVTPGF
jgi:hypothetical protein